MQQWGELSLSWKGSALLPPPWRSRNITSEYDKGGSKTSLKTSQDKPPCGGKKKDKRPQINRPPKSDSDIITYNKYKTLEVEIDDNDSSDLDYRIFLKIRNE